MVVSTRRSARAAASEPAGEPKPKAKAKAKPSAKAPKAAKPKARTEPPPPPARRRAWWAAPLAVAAAAAALAGLPAAALGAQGLLAVAVAATDPAAVAATDPAGAEAAVVLGFKLQGDGSPSPPLRNRVAAAAGVVERAVEGPGGTAAVYRGVVFSGGHPGGGERGGTSEAAAMKRHFVHKLAGRGQLFEVGSRFPRARSPRRLTALPPPDAAPCRS